MPPYVPRHGDLVWLDFDPQSGHEQAGFRPALVLSADRYNTRSGLAVDCPITTQPKGYEFEVPLPPGLAVVGVVLCDQEKSVDWTVRGIRFAGTVPPSVLTFVVSSILRPITYPNLGEPT